MKTVQLSGSPRENVGKQNASDLRKQKRVPCVLYGQANQIHFSVHEEAMKKLFWTSEVFLIELTISDKKRKAIIQEVQQHPVTDRIIHVDFLEVVDNKPVKVKIPLHTTGSSIGVLAGGKMVNNYRKIMVKGLISNIPEFLEIDITKMNISDNVRIKDLKIDGLTLLEDQNSVVTAIKTSRVSASMVIEELPLAPVEGAEGAEGTEGTEGATTDEKKGQEAKSKE